VSVRLSLLALLDQGECYGYQLRTELDWRTGGGGPINVGQIYNTLDRLERDKLVRKTGENNYYGITDAGRTAVAVWFGSASPSADFPAKIALASTLPGVDARAIIRAQRVTVTAAGHANPRTAAELAAALVATAASISAKAQLDLLDAAEQMLSLGIAPTPLSADIPKRGRPARVAN